MNQKLNLFFIFLFCFSINAKTQHQDTIPRPIRTSYYIEPGSYGTKRATDPPDYVENFGKIKPSFSFLNVGLDTRERFELRHNDLRRPQSLSNDFPLLMRQRIYIGVVEALDPLRFTVEFQDSRRINGNYPLDTRDVNKNELIQGFAELYFDDLLPKDALGNKRPVSLRFGRMAFEFLDRRLIGANLWRNTTNTFTGFRLSLGQDKNDWQIDLLAIKPIERQIAAFDTTETNRTFTAAIGHWRKWSEIVTIEPYYMALRQAAAPTNNNISRNIHGFGLRAYGWQNGWNYDFTGMYQIGTDNNLEHRAFSFTSEVGHTWKSSIFKPRLSAFFGYVSGDKDPNDGVSNRFERFYGFGRPWSPNDYVIMENIVTPKIKIEFQKKIKNINFKAETGYSNYWLASSTDRFSSFLNGSTNNRDKTGNSGRFLGHELDGRVVFSPLPYFTANIGYTHFFMGDFVKNRQLIANGESANGSDFLFVELSFDIFDLFNHFKK